MGIGGLSTRCFEGGRVIVGDVLGGGSVMLTDSLVTLQLTVSQSHTVLMTYPNPDDSKPLER